MVTSSNYHLEFCPSDVGNNDKFIISHVIKETSSFAQLDSESQKNFKVIVLLEADKMTKEAQSALSPVTLIAAFPGIILTMLNVKNSLSSLSSVRDLTRRKVFESPSQTTFSSESA